MVDDINKGESTGTLSSFVGKIQELTAGIGFSVGALMDGFDENALYKKTVEEVTQKIKDGSKYSDEESLRISDLMNKSIHWGSHFISGVGKRVQDSLYPEESPEKEKSRLLSLYLVIFFYRLDNALDESPHYKKHPTEKQEVLNLFNDYICGNISDEVIMGEIETRIGIETDLIFVAHEIKKLIPDNNKGQELLQDIRDLGDIVATQSNKTPLSNDIKKHIEPLLEGIPIHSVEEGLQERILTAIALGYKTSHVVISSLGVYSKELHQEFYDTFSLLNASMQMKDDLWDQNIDIEDGQSTPYSELENIPNRLQRSTQFKKVESVRKALYEKYKNQLKKLPKEQQKLLHGLEFSTSPMLWMKSIKTVKALFPE